MFLYLVKLSRPDLSNAVRELSKMMDIATEGHYKNMLRVIKYVVNTCNYGLKFTPLDKKWKMIGYSDSDFSGGKSSRLSISGFMIYIKGVLVS